MLKKSFVLKENIKGKDIPEFLTTVDVTLDDRNISLVYNCKNSQCFSAYEGYNTDIFDGDVCEVFICTSGDISTYYEIEVAPNNSVYLAGVYNPKLNKNIQSTYIEENFLESSVEINGSDYIVRLKVPLEKIGYDKEKGLLLNIFRIETEGGITDKNILAANPTRCKTFHKPKFFFKLED